MPRIRRRRTRIRIYSFISAGFLAATGLAVTGFFMAYTLRMNIEYSYERSLSELSEHLGNIDLSLQKAQYAGTNAQLVNIASGIRSESAAAKNDLSQIAISNVNFNSTSKFIAQTGDYANALAQTLTENAKITAADRDRLKTLYGSAETLSQQVNSLVANVQSGRITLFKSDEAVSDLGKDKTKTVNTVASGFQNMEDDMTSLPSLIYDGPFSDNVMRRKPELTKGKAQIDRATARRISASFFSLTQKNVKDDGNTDGTLPTYNFVCGTKNVYVSKFGGYLVRMLDSRTPGAAKLSTATALIRAQEFLKSHGINYLKPTYYLTGSNICVINFAHVQDGATCYTDLIKVGIALDTGEVAFFDATGYIMNHKYRKFSAQKFTAASARARLSPNLTVKTVSLALIPKNGTGEVLCYEFKCTAENGTKNVIDYFNVSSGIEEQILILTKTPGGTLAM